ARQSLFGENGPTPRAPSASSLGKSRSSRLRLPASFLGRLNLSRLDEGSGWIGTRMHENNALDNLDLESRDFFLERRRRRSRLRLILISMPWAGDAAIDDATFP